MTVTSLFIQPAAGYRWTFKERHTLGVQAAPGINIQVPITGPGDEDRGDMFSVLIREFLYLNLGVWYYNPLTERFGFNFKFELNLPVYNAWAGTGLPFSDGIMVNFSGWNPGTGPSKGRQHPGLIGAGQSLIRRVGIAGES